MPSYFVQLIKYYCCWHFAEAVTDQITKAQYWQSVAVGALSENGRGGAFREAVNVDGTTSPNNNILDFALIEARNS